MVYRVSREPSKRPPGVKYSWASSVLLTFEDTKCGTIIYGESGNGKKEESS